MNNYEPNKIEKKWQKQWETDKLYETPDSIEGKENFYQLFEFAYTSGDLHIGHWYAFSVPDIFARYKRMQGYNVLYPIGVDAFGLPAENAAIKNKVHPGKWTGDGIKKMSDQLRTMGAMLDWSRFVDTSDPKYYKWTQWIFLQFLKKDLAYRAKTKVNWCPKDKTVIANEQVIDGKCERCGTVVIQKELEQWMYRTTAYAQELLDGLNNVAWPETTRVAQQNWIGRKDGLVIKHKTKDLDLDLETFTAFPGWIFADTFIVIAPEHPLVAQLVADTDQKDAINEFVKLQEGKTSLKRAQDEKEGVFTGRYAVDPLTGEDMPIWVANFVLMDFGTGIIRCSAHDPRDYDFAQKYDIKLKEVVERDGEGPINAHNNEGTLINSNQFDGLTVTDAQHKIKKWAISENIAIEKTTYRLRDWILSRQRYWGTPIPMIICDKCGYVPVSEDQLPVKLPSLNDYLPGDDGQSPLAKATNWVNVKCPQCDGDAKRETDTMDTFVDSSWYFLRYVDPNNDEELASKDKLKKWTPVDLYTGGAEHNTMHLLYSRFFTKALKDLGLVDFDEPFKVRRNHGTVLGPDGDKMSKSKGNIINPDKEVKTYGADTVRMYLAFLGPYDTFIGPWDPKSITGVHRFLNRTWKLSQGEFATEKTNSNILHKTIAKVGKDIEGLQFNIAISQLMILLNAFEKNAPTKEEFEIFVKLLSPFAPHFAEEIWKETFGNSESVHLAQWPEFDKELIKDDEITIAVQVNGKTKGKIFMPPGASEQDVVDVIKKDDKLSKHLGEIKKTIYVQDRIVNFVI